MTGRYAARRLLQLVPILIGLTLVVFLLLSLVPGDPARTLLGPQAPPEAVEALRVELGLDQPAPQRYLDYVTGLLRGDLGTSLTYDLPVAELIGGRVLPTLMLIAYAGVLVVALAVPLAVVASRYRHRWAGRLVRVVPLVGLGLPSFWVGLMLVLVFGVQLGWFPVGGEGEGFVGRLHAMFLPALTVAIALLPIMVRSLGSALVEVSEAEYLTTARAKGLTERRTLLAYSLRNAVVPAISVLGVNLAWLVGNTVVIERIFAIEGLGATMIEAITNRDFPVVQSLAMIFGLVVVLVSLATDLTRAALDPRIRLS